MFAKPLFPMALTALLTIAACGGYEPVGPTDIGYGIEGDWVYGAEMTQSVETQVERCKVTDMRIRFSMGKPEGSYGNRALGGVVASGSLECVVAGVAATVPLAGVAVTGDLALLAFSFRFTAAHPGLGPVIVISNWTQGVNPAGTGTRWEGTSAAEWSEFAPGQTPVGRRILGSWAMDLVAP